MSKDTGGPAFPQITELGDVAATSNGMTLRDYFAAKAMAARLTDYKSMESLLEYAVRTGHDLADMVADQSYSMADAMIAQRSKP